MSWSTARPCSLEEGRPRRWRVAKARPSPPATPSPCWRSSLSQTLESCQSFKRRDHGTHVSPMYRLSPFTCAVCRSALDVFRTLMPIYYRRSDSHTRASRHLRILDLDARRGVSGAPGAPQRRGCPTALRRRVRDGARATCCTMRETNYNMRPTALSGAHLYSPILPLSCTLKLPVYASYRSS